MAEHNSRSGRSPKAGQGALSVLALATLAVVAALAGVILWLALSAGDTMERLRAEADRRGLYAELTLPPPAPEPPAPVEPPAEPPAVAPEGAPAQIGRAHV